MTPYIVGRLFHAILAAVITVLLLQSGQAITKSLAIPVSMSLAHSSNWSLWLTRMGETSYQLGILLGIMLVLSFAIHLARSISGYIKR